MISIDGVEFDKYLQIPDWHTATRALGSDRVTLNGNVVSQRYVGQTLRKVTLTARLEGQKLFGHFTRAQVEVLREIRDAGRRVSILYHDNAVTGTIPMDGVNVSMIGNRTDPDVDHPYVGTVSIFIRI